MQATIRRGDDLLIFPEGQLPKRHNGEYDRDRPYYDLLPLQKGAGWLAENNDVVIIPMALIGTDRLFPPQARAPRVGQRIRVAFGEPMPSEELWPKSRREITSEVNARLRELIRATA